MHQTAVRLPTGLYQKLVRVGGRRGLGAEIRRRLELSFAKEEWEDNLQLLDIARNGT